MSKEKWDNPRVVKYTLRGPMRKKAAAELKIDYSNGITGRQLGIINAKVEEMMGKVSQGVTLTTGGLRSIKGSGRII